MFKKIIRQQNLNGVGNGSRATAEMGSLGSTIHGIVLSFLKADGSEMSRAEMIADIDTIYLRVGGDLKFEVSPKFALDLYKYYNDKNNGGNPTGQILLMLAPQDFMSEQERTVFAYGTQNVDSFIIEVAFKNHGAFKTSTVEMRTQQSDMPSILGQHRKIRRYQYNYDGSGGQFDINSLPNRIAEMAYKNIHIEEGSTTIDSTTVKIATSEIFKDVTPSINKLINSQHGHTNQAGYFHLDFNLDENLSGGLPMLNVADFRQEIHFAGKAEGFFVYTEEIWGLKLATK